MNESSIPSVRKYKYEKPKWLNVFIIYGLIFAGIVPVIFLLYLFISGNAAGMEINLLLALPINLGVIISAVGAWKGKNIARIFFFILISINYILIGINNLMLMNSDIATGNEISRIGRGIIYPALYIWYFNRVSVKECFS
ncbi:MAG: hypothetical protein ACYDH1_21170 [Anaerolineaceae bacterium]